MNSSVPLRRGCLIALALLLSYCAPGASQENSTGTKRGEIVRNSIFKFDNGNSPYKAWLQQDVVWIISDEERAAFKLLKNDEERDHFIEAFWSRRDPTPDTFENEYKEEHYRRIVYANDHFGATVPGWKSDRGRMYIMFGPPDEIESYAAKDQDNTPGEDPSSYPLEIWHYTYIEGIGENVGLEFVDACKCGDYHMAITRLRKENLRTVPSWHLVEGWWGRLDRVPNGLGNPPRIKFKELEEKVNAQLKWKTLPIEVSIGTTKVTDFSSLVPITISVRRSDIVFVNKNGSRHATLNVFERAMTPAGHVAEIFEGPFDIDALSESEPSSGKEAATFSNTLVLRTAPYRIEIALQDANSDHWATWAGEVGSEK
jgi:GWxTD domain-containing protein